MKHFTKQLNTSKVGCVGAHELSSATAARQDRCNALCQSMEDMWGEVDLE